MESVKEILKNSMMELLEAELNEFQWYLKNNECISNSEMENADRLKTVDKMLACFGPEQAVTITLDILRKMNQNHWAEQLENNYKQGSVLENSKASLCDYTEISLRLKNKLMLDHRKILVELDLSNNDLQDSGVKLLSDGLKSPNCTLEILRLSGCMVTEEGCLFVSSALSSNPSHLRELDLSYNHPGKSGVKLLSAKVNHPNYRLEKLNVDHGGEFRITVGIRKYACFLTLDPNTANTRLVLSEDNRMKPLLVLAPPGPKLPRPGLDEEFTLTALFEGMLMVPDDLTTPYFSGFGVVLIDITIVVIRICIHYVTGGQATGSR
ncbi:hypothetical protein Q8A67_000037 [Cirrhinus molitorella]|uniref:Pyrin domain-containing protein n=1 Tax=Cirrhinus molitorella TaxID=172907 RepID=A0AA88QEI9_9TELE|nr:hypothetical protein Q8A67_000037 [Cirrhinus molitorella]